MKIRVNNKEVYLWCTSDVEQSFTDEAGAKLRQLVELAENNTNEVSRDEECIIYVREEVWNRLVGVARNRPSPLRAFFMFSPRSAGWPIRVVDCLEVPVKMIKESSPSGPIFRWDIPGSERLKYYRPKNDPLRYSGTVLIQPCLEMTLHYAYFMGIDFKGWGGFNINLWVDDKGNPIYKAYFVSQNRTHGEFIECRVKTYKAPHILQVSH